MQITGSSMHETHHYICTLIMLSMKLKILFFKSSAWPDKVSNLCVLLAKYIQLSHLKMLLKLLSIKIENNFTKI